MMLYGTEYLVG